jgi:tetratricopeptide (TPR) repeat protein
MKSGAMVRHCEGAKVRHERRFVAPSHCRTIALAVLLVVPSVAPAQPVKGLTGGPQLERAYKAIFDGRFEDVPDVLAQTCPPLPLAACEVLDALSIWWQIQIDPLSTAHDALFKAHVDAAVIATQAWTMREPQRAEAWFYLGAAYGVRVQWNVLRGERLAAARDGKQIKESLERALALDPGMQDAYFGIGLYHYYADIAPAAAKMLRWILFLPGGDRVKGMQEMLRARDNGQVLRDEADYQLQVIDLWYEKRPEHALELLAGLRRRHPANPHFLQLIAEVEDVYLHEIGRSLRSSQALLEAARRRRVSNAPMAEAIARLGIALQLDRFFETDRAIEHLRLVIAAQPTAPFGALAQAQLQLAQALDRLGQRSEAVDAYRAALAATTTADPLRIAGRARAGLKTTPNATTARAYRLSLEGWRALERGALDEAARALGESLALRPGDLVTQYRQARLLKAQKNDAAAIALLDMVRGGGPTLPPSIYAAACVDEARILEEQGERARAIELYQAVSGVVGAEYATTEAAQRALARLTTAPRAR